MDDDWHPSDHGVHSVFDIYLRESTSLLVVAVAAGVRVLLRQLLLVPLLRLRLQQPEVAEVVAVVINRAIGAL